MDWFVCESPDLPFQRGRTIIIDRHAGTVTFVRCHTPNWGLWPEAERICPFAEVRDVLDMGHKIGGRTAWVTTIHGRAYLGSMWAGYRQCVETLRQIADSAPADVSYFNNARFLRYVLPIVAGAVILVLAIWFTS